MKLKRLPPPTPQDRAESDQDGHPDKVKAKGRQKSLMSSVKSNIVIEYGLHG